MFQLCQHFGVLVARQRSGKEKIVTRSRRPFFGQVLPSPPQQRILQVSNCVPVLGREGRRALERGHRGVVLPGGGKQGAFSDESVNVVFAKL